MSELEVGLCVEILLNSPDLITLKLANLCKPLFLHAPLAIRTFLPTVARTLTKFRSQQKVTTLSDFYRIKLNAVTEIINILVTLLSFCIFAENNNRIWKHW